ncbi:DUF1819 family protein [Clostridium sp. FP2]|uniref:DUF1819 family protein n=1 Tax=Clostridium sp. FP2 TaxID=2724481 RepID=UPI0013E9581B|nr:DUF1819 family protein [Clostridium sp. FP2]MBZ9624419.1 DUF1819 family protein [Clostridium sp. FP2]
MQEYSSGFTSERVIKNEMTQVIRLYLQGKTKDEIRDIVIDENLFNMRSVAAIKESLSKINRRINYLDENLMRIYVNSNSNDSMAILFYTFLSSFRIAREFVVEVIYHNWFNYKKIVTTADINCFFDDKAQQSDVISKWTESTSKRIKNRVLEFCTQCGILEKEKGEFNIKPLQISAELRNYIKDNDEYKKILIYILLE